MSSIAVPAVKLTFVQYPQIPAAFAVLNHLLRQIDDFQRRPIFQHGWRGCDTSNSDIPACQRSPMQTLDFFQSRDRQVFAKAAVRHIGQSQLRSPVA